MQLLDMWQCDNSTKWKWDKLIDILVIDCESHVDEGNKKKTKWKIHIDVYDTAAVK